MTISRRFKHEPMQSRMRMEDYSHLAWESHWWKDISVLHWKRGWICPSQCCVHAWSEEWKLLLKDVCNERIF